MKIGISDLGIYIPRNKIELLQLADPAYAGTQADRMKDAILSTEQHCIRFPNSWEDPVTMAAESAKDLFTRLTPHQIQSIRHVGIGTETSVDFAKPISAYMTGILKSNGFPISNNLSSFQVQHACAGGTMAAIHIGSMLVLSSKTTDTGLAVCTDIARYEAKSTAEITQGSGAIALFLEPNPKLLSLDLSTVGYASNDVDDFFRPIGSTTARVRGRYSFTCYMDSFLQAFEDHAHRRNLSIEALVDATDFFVLHTPFKSMPEMAMVNLLKHTKGFTKEQSLAYLTEHGFYRGTTPIAEIGNSYTASIFLSLAFLLESTYRAMGNAMIGKQILLASYGSGNTMIIISATVQEHAPEIIKTWNTPTWLDNSQAASMKDYQAWMLRDVHSKPDPSHRIDPDRYYLSTIREDGYRVYAYQKP